MTLDDLERRNMVFLWIFGDFRLRNTFRERIAPKSIEIDMKKLRMKFSAFNVVFPSLNFAPPSCVQGILCTRVQTWAPPSKYSHSATQTAAAIQDGGAIWRM